MCCVLVTLNLWAQQKTAFQVFILDNKGIEKKLKSSPFYESKNAADAEANSIISSLRSMGYLLADIDSIRYDTTSYKAYIHSGEKYKWARLSQGNVDDNMLSSSGYHEKMYINAEFSPREVSRLMEKILVYCEDNGYPFARVKLDSVVISGNTIRAQLWVNKQRLVKVDSVILVGNATIKKKYLFRYLHIKEGSLYNERQVRQVEQRLRQLPFVKQSKQQIVRITERDARLILYLDKKNASQFDGIIGLQPQLNGKTVLTGNLNIQVVNGIFKHGEQLGIAWQRLQYQTQNLTAGVVYPYLFNTPLGIDYTFTLYKRDTTYINLQNNIGLQYLFSGLNYFKVFFKSVSTNLLSTSALAGATVLPDYADISLNSYGASFFYEKLNYKFNPRSGISFHVTASAGGRTIHQNPKLDASLYNGIQLKSTQYQFDANMAGYIPIFKRSTIKLAFQGGSINSPQLFTNELYRIGGFKSIRGINEQSVYASMYGITSIEYHFLFEQNSAFLLFADGAWYQNNSYNNSFPKRDMPYSFGAGVMFQTKAGVFQLNYALAHQFDNPFSLRSGKINFGYISVF
ncbi:MAG: hypothetical protein JST67_10305 [Bacteroidetes bacterium]|nr:hypothetical protein [Bacteroidota bacterium]